MFDDPQSAAWISLGATVVLVGAAVLLIRRPNVAWIGWLSGFAAAVLWCVRFLIWDADESFRKLFSRNESMLTTFDGALSAYAFAFCLCAATAMLAIGFVSTRR